uniref:G protein alpha subunit n=1 Tax=Timema douglasi TaxID=61478 RepID=A0A7R8Z9F1_TIMDO|nr:unnamed protein product [Timema douglasi]
MAPVIEMCTCCLRFKLSPEELEQRMKSQEIDKLIEKDKYIFRRQVKLLLLGAGESGKSTFLKQMRIIHGVKFEPELVKEYQHVIYQNIVRGMKVLTDARDKLGIPWENSKNCLYSDQILQFDNNMMLDGRLFLLYAPSLYNLWKDSGIKKAYERRREFQLSDSVQYFLDNLERIARSILNDFHGVSHFRRTNRLEESQNIFDTIVNNLVFRGVSIILFLNKTDLLEEKLNSKRSDIRLYFPEFSGDPHSLGAVQEFILAMFVAVKRDRRKPLFHHFTTAVDTENIKIVFNAVKDTILHRNLESLMLHPQGAKTLQKNKTSAKHSEHVLAERLTETAVLAERLTETAVLAERLAETAVLAERLTETSVLAERLTETGVLAERLTETGVLAERLTETAVLAERLAAGPYYMFLI